MNEIGDLKLFAVDLTSKRLERGEQIFIFTAGSLRGKLLAVSQREHDLQIRDFVEARTGAKMLKGAAFYQLTKTEPKVQDYKIIAVQNKQTGEVYAGPAARQMAGLPQYGDCRVAPDDLGEWNVFIQSTSVNRKVVAGTTPLYWPNVGKAFTEGKSA